MGAPSQATSERITPGTRIGNYQVERVVGSGGMGTVFAAKHVGLDKPVAIKTLSTTLASDPKAVRRFVREGRAASKIRHPHVVDVTDVGTHEGLPFLVMELLDGEDLHTRLEACGRLTASEIARIMLPVLDALAFAHDAGVIHRDLKPSNIFLARGPHGEVPIVLDFGIAKIVESDSLDAETITIAASYLGTPYYSAPEQAMGNAEVDARADQYSIGAIMYELATGQHGLPGETPFEVLSAIVARQRAEITLIGGVDPQLCSIVTRAMTYEPEGRFASIRHLGHALLPLAPRDVRDRWSAAFDVGTEDGLGFAETMNNGPRVPLPESSGSHRAPAFTPSGVLPVPSASESSGQYVAPRPEPSGQHTAPRLESSGQHAAPRFEPSGQHTAPRLESSGQHAAPSFTRPSAAPGTPVGVSTVSQPPPERRSGLGLALAAVGGLLVAAGVAGGLWWWQTHQAQTTEVVFRASPATATFELDGQALEGAGTVTAPLPNGAERHRLVVRAEGYATRTLEIDLDTLPEEIVLEPASGEPENQIGGAVDPGETEPGQTDPEEGTASGEADGTPSDDEGAPSDEETAGSDQEGSPSEEAPGDAAEEDRPWYEQGSGNRRARGGSTSARRSSSGRTSGSTQAPIRRVAPSTGRRQRSGTPPLAPSPFRTGANNSPVVN